MINPNGLAALRSFTLERKATVSPSTIHLTGSLTGDGELNTDWLCMIGAAGSWLWVETIKAAQDSNFTEVLTDNFHLEEADSVLYVLPPEFQPPIAFTLLDDANVWEESTFGCGNAAAAKVMGTDGKPWTRLRQVEDDGELEEGEVLRYAAWDHEHCSLCNKHIYPEMEFFSIPYEKTGRFFLCPYCYKRFGASHSLDIVIYPGYGDRVGEPD